nr:MAG: capsid protein [Cressdnaviricota sp.]
MPMTTRFRGTKTPAMSRPSPLNALVKRGPTKTKARKLRPTTAMAKMIKQVIAKTNETKYLTEVILNAFPVRGGTTTPSVYINFNSIVSAGTDFYRCLPVLNQGATAYTRVGDSISPVSLKTTWDFSFSPTSSDANSRDITVVMYILRPKQQSQYPVTTANGQVTANFNFLDAGNGTLSSYTGNQLATYFPVDTRNYTLIKKKLIRLYKPYGTQNTNSPPTASGSATLCATQTLRTKYSHTWKKMKSLRYDAGNTVPANWGDVWCAGYYYNDGSPPDAGGGLLQIGCYAELRFKDD